MNKKENWFEVDRQGLKELQLGKPKHYIARELVQNAWDEQTKTCKLEANYINGIVTLSVEDDNPLGFKDISDAFTLFRKTEKRKNPEQRGRFNLGEKQSFSICESAIVETTKGSILFDKDGRTEAPEQKRSKGSKVIVNFKATEQEFKELLAEFQLSREKKVNEILGAPTIDFAQLSGKSKIEFEKGYKEYCKDGALRFLKEKEGKK
jgi:hypothetical protein